MHEKKRIKALIIDDSKIVRDILSDILTKDPDIIVCGAANDPFEAVKLIQKNLPDVLTLDLEMPKMDGITFLKKLMKQHPIPTIVISSYTGKNKQLTLQAYENGATYVIDKPEIENEQGFEEYSMRIRALVKAAGRQTKYDNQTDTQGIDTLLNPSQPVITQVMSLIKSPPEVIAIGASAGGTTAIERILTKLETSVPPILITQHMPPGFTKEFADRINSLCLIEVCEAKGNEVLKPGYAYIAPGDKHLTLTKKGNDYLTQLDHGQLVNHHRPSVDVLFTSVARHAGSNALSIILTGMGRDGAKGMLKIRKAGGITLAQDKYSSAVFGMPAEALRIGAAQMDIHLDNFGTLINQLKNT